MKQLAILSISLLISLFALNQNICDCFDESLVDPFAICPTVHMPVCGCDGETYGNDCEAINSGVLSWVDGPCSSNIVVECDDLSNVDFGECAMPLGIGIVNGLCSYISGCSTTGIDNVDYSGALFDSMEDCQCCQQSQCINPNQIDPNGICTFEYDPVCGCNDVNLWKFM